MIETIWVNKWGEVLIIKSEIKNPEWAVLSIIDELENLDELDGISLSSIDSNFNNMKVTKALFSEIDNRLETKGE